MSNQNLAKRVHSELREAAASGLLPSAVQERATKLLARLDRPVRLALMGMPGSGKSTLLNLLVGRNVMKEGVRLPTLQLSYGDVAQAICTLPDGSRQVLDTVDVAAIAALSPVFVDMRMPLPALSKISVLEVVAPDDVVAIQRATQWAAKRCDIALWCTRGFVEAEQLIWQPMPDLIKDHAFCMMTRADTLRADGLLDAALGAVEAKAREEFNMVLPIGTVEAIAARRPDGTVDRDQLRASGGMALISAVLKQVDQGRQSTVDMADILLQENAAYLSQADTAPTVQGSTPATTPAPEPAAPEPAIPPQRTTDAIARLRELAAEKARNAPKVPDETTEDKAPASDKVVRLAEAAPKPAKETPPPIAPKPAPVIAEKAATKPQKGKLEPATRAAYEHVVSYIATQSQSLAEQLTTMGEEGPTEVMERAVEHIQWLCDYLNDNGDDADPSLMRARDTAFDAADMVQLMRLEKRDSAALEAVSLMLQIKRELQADLAA